MASTTALRTISMRSRASARQRLIRIPEQNGAGWMGLSRLDACRHGVDCFVKDGSPDIASKRLYGVESERSCGEGHDCLVCSWDFVARLMERCGGNGCGGQDKGYDGSGLVESFQSVSYWLFADSRSSSAMVAVTSPMSAIFGF